MKHDGFFGCRLGRILPALLLVLAEPILAQETNENTLVDREFEFASGLISQLKMPDLAEKVMDQLEVSFPESRERAKVIRAEALIARRRFKQAEAIVAEMPKDSPKAQAIMLALADGYYQVGEQEKTRGLYIEFFNRFTNAVPDDPDLKRFFRDSAYRFGQILALGNDPLGAAKMYDKMIPLMGADERDETRQIKMEQAELLLRGTRAMPAGAERAALLKKARANCDEVIWGGMDIWFGRAVTGLAQADLIEGYDEKAIALLEKNMPILKKADKLLSDTAMINESPLAGARSLLGAIHQDRADVLTGTREIREAEALRFFERAAEQYEAQWKLILRINTRDATLLDLSKKNKTTYTLPGTPTQRQEAAAAFEKGARTFSELLAKLENDGWSGAVAERKNKLKDRLQKMRDGLSAYKKEVGVSPLPELIVGSSFSGNLDIARGLEYLDTEEARKKRATGFYVKALTEFYNVFAGYPGSEWSASASEKVTTVKDRLKALTGQEITIESKQGGKEKIAKVTIREGHSLFGRKEYAKAAEQYLKAVNDYPEGEESIGALANLMECDVKLNDLHGFKATAFYLGERFAGNPVAAQGLLRVGRLFFEANNRELYQFAYEQYLACFPEHASAPDILFMLGEQRWKYQDYEGAVGYYRRLAQRYSKTPRYLQAMNRIGWAYYLSGDFKNAIDGFTQYLAEAQAGTEKAQAKLCLADSYRQLKEFATAFRHYEELTGWLENKGGPYSTSVDAMRKNEDVHRQALFFMGHCRAMMAEAGEAGAAARKDAVAMFRRFVDAFPGSPLAPTALSSMGAVLLGNGQSAEASAIFDELAKSYPDSDAGQNAKLAMVRSLMEIGQAPKAREVLAEMARDADKYPADQFLMAGLMLEEKGEHEGAVLALRKAIERFDATPADVSPARLSGEQRALIALGEALTALGRYAEAAVVLQKQVDKFPKSALFYEARFLLGRAYKEDGKLDDAVNALRDVFQRATNQVLITRATMELADIQIAQKDPSGALASYQRIVLLNHEIPAIRPLFRQALYRSIGLFRDMGKWTDVVENCDQFTAEFPTGEGVEEVRRWRAEAIMKLSTGGAP